MINQHLHVMTSSERLEVLNTPERLIIDPGPQETEPAESLGLSRAGLDHVAHPALKNSALKVSKGPF